MMSKVKQGPPLHVGIDPGVMTGYAESCGGKLMRVESMTAVAAESLVTLSHAGSLDQLIKLHIEDARLRTWVTGGREKLQGVGSVKRDCSRWVEFCQHHKIDYVLVPPRANRTKLTAAQFERLTGWTERTNEHGRDAAMLVFGR